MLKKILVLAVLMIAIVSCAGAKSPEGWRMTNHAPDPVAFTEHETLYVDTEFTVAQQKTLMDGVDEMNRALNGYEVIEVKGVDMNDTDRLEELLDSGTGIFVTKLDFKDTDDIEGGVLAYTNMEYRAITMLPSRIGDRDFKGIFLHELGHAMGLQHSNVANSLMWPSYQRMGRHCVDLEMVKALASRHLTWDVQHMNWCE